MSHQYYTHRKYLTDALNSLDKNKKINILEFGVGDGSSFVFNEFASKNKNFNIKAFETDKSWFEETKSKYELDNYEFIHINDWNELLVQNKFKDEYDLIFIDQSPWESRIKTLDLLINQSSILILHDYDFYNKGLIEDIFDTGENSFFGKYLSENISVKGFFEQLPPTLVFTKN
jgi:cellulose biosynthesis protein BcsQ